MKLNNLIPKIKYVSWSRPERTEAIRWPVVRVDEFEVVVRFDYPWEGHEECLKEHGYDENYH